MPFVSVTRLRIRSVRFLPAFALYTLRSLRQIRTADGFLDGELLPDRKWTFWTLTLWDTAEQMRAYRNTAAHMKAMPKLRHWCDEASVVHWNQPRVALPGWKEADQRMRTEGRVSKVNYPSPAHAGMTFAAPRLTLRRPIRSQKA